MTFQDKLKKCSDLNNSLLCIGLDPDFEKLPITIKKQENPQFEFNKAIINTTHDLVCAYKPNPAFYEAKGDRGVSELRMTCDYIRENFQDIPIIIDAKRGDIGNTNKGSAQYVFDYLGADAITVMPYMGIESLAPYFAWVGKGVILGCHSSNAGAKEFQELIIDNKPLYEIVAKELMKQYGTNPNSMIFMGATYPEQLTEIRKIVGDMTILIPGVGAQGGNTKQTVKAGLNSKKAGMIINYSRSIIFAANDESFAQEARNEANKMKNEINKYRKL